MSTPYDLASGCDHLARQLRRLGEHRDQCQQDLAKLIELGTVKASEHWRDGKYLYLIHPTDSCGQRKREYIGADPTKIANARAAIARQHAADELRRQIRGIDEQTNEAWRWVGYALSKVESALATTGALQDDAGVTKQKMEMVTTGTRSSSASVTNQKDFW